MPEPAARHHEGPAFLRGLDHVLPTDTGWIARCPVFGCDSLLHITPGIDEHWRFDCRGEHTHQEIVDYLQCDTRLDPVRASRVWRALMLARTPEQWQALLDGQAVPLHELDPLWVRRFGLK